MFKVQVSSHTDVGDVKQTNQDCILVKQGEENGHQVGLFIVADGCGGMAYGEEISNLVVTHFSRVWNHELKGLFQQKNISSTELDEIIEKAIRDINAGAMNFSKQVESKVGSTLSLLLTVDNKYIIKNVGDSRVYLKRKNKINQLTEDQSLVADMIRNGEITKDEAKEFKKKNVLTMCIGVFVDIKTYTCKGKIKNGDTFLICCDGLHNKVSENSMIRIIKSNRKFFEGISLSLREAIEQGDANDNVSSIVCEFKKKAHPIRNTILIILVVLLIAFSIWFVYSWDHIYEHWILLCSFGGMPCPYCMPEFYSFGK